MISLSELKEYAKKGYEPGRIFNELHFERDFANFTLAKRAINRFLKSGAIEDKLVMNLVIVCLNVFGKEKTNIIFRSLLDDVQFSVVKAILMYLRQFDFSGDCVVYPNRIMIDILRDMDKRFGKC